MSVSTVADGMPAKEEAIAVAAAARWRIRPEISGEGLVLLSALYFSLFSNGAFWHTAIAHPLPQWRFVLSLFLVVTALHALLLGLVANRWIIKPLLTVLLLVTAVASHYMTAYGVYLDADMLRNVLHTDSKESSELLSPRLLVPLAWSLVPIALLWRVRLRRRGMARAVMVRAAFLLAMALIAAGGVMLSSQDFSTLFRSHREVRYLVTPANYVVSLSNVLLSSPPGPKKALLPVGLDARQARAPRQAASSGSGGRGDRARAELGPEWLRAPDHAGTFADSGPDQFPAGRLPAAPAPKYRCPACSRHTAVATMTKTGSAATNRCCTCWTMPASPPCGATTSPAARACATGLPIAAAGRCQGSGSVQWQALPGRDPAQGPADAAVAGEGRPRGGAAPAGQPWPQLLRALPAGVQALHAHLRQSGAGPVRARSRSSTPTTTRCCTPIMCWPRPSASCEADRIRHRADLCLRPWRIAGREGPVPARHSLRHRPRRADPRADGDVVFAGLRQRFRAGSGLPAPAKPRSRRATTTCFLRCWA